MEGLAAFALAATATQLAAHCLKIADGLHKIHTKQGRAADSLQAIHRECKTLAAAAEGIESWANTIDARSESRKRQCASLDEALRCLTPSIEILGQEVDKILNKIQNDGELPMRARVRYLWKEEDMNMHLTEVRWQANHIHLLLTTINLPANEASAKLRRLSDVVSEHYSFGDGQSMLSTTEFAFDDQVVNSVVYRRALLAAKRVTQSPGTSRGLASASGPLIQSQYANRQIVEPYSAEDARPRMPTIEESQSEGHPNQMEDMVPPASVATQPTALFGPNPTSEIQHGNEKRKSWRRRLWFWPKAAPRARHDDIPTPKQQGTWSSTTGSSGSAEDENRDVELDIVVSQDVKAQGHFKKEEFADAIRIWQGALRHLEDIGGDGASYECKAIEMTARVGIAHVKQARQGRCQPERHQFPAHHRLLDTMHHVREIIHPNWTERLREFNLGVVPQILRGNTIRKSTGGREIRQCCFLVLQELLDCSLLEAAAYESFDALTDYTEHASALYNEALLFAGSIRSRGCNFPLGDSACINLFAGLAGCHLLTRDHQRYRAIISEIRANSDGGTANQVELQVVRRAMRQYVQYAPSFSGGESSAINPMLTYIMGVVVRLSRSGSVRDLDLEKQLIEHLYQRTHYQPLITLLGQLEWEKTDYFAKAGLYLGAAYLKQGKPAEAKRALRSTITSAQENRSDLSDFHTHLAFLYDIYKESGEDDIAAGYYQEIPQSFWHLPHGMYFRLLGREYEESETPDGTA